MVNSLPGRDLAVAAVLPCFEPCQVPVQFVRRMGFRSPKPLVMFRPRGDMAVQKRPPTAATSPDGSPAAFPIRVADRMDVGYMIKYRLQFDDGAVSVGLTELAIYTSAYCAASCQRVERVQHSYCCALLQPPHCVQHDLHPSCRVVKHQLRLIVRTFHGRNCFARESELRPSCTGT
jgi:hypothetical protein